MNAIPAASIERIEVLRDGAAESTQLALTLNLGIEMGEGELYGFITYSSRDNESAAFFRHNGNSGGNAPLADGDATIPAGFLPLINSAIDDKSFNFGYRREFDDGATLDLSYTRGKNTIDSLNGCYSLGALSVNLALNRYGEYAVTDGGAQVYGAKLLTDLRIGYDLSGGIGLHLGANNLFDVTPDRNTIGNSRAGAIEDGPGGGIVVDSAGVFQYSRRSAPFGFNGAYYYAGASYRF